ncbi:hypothetical protein [Catellatospora chokoriensis]|uniref:Uncharacterized protein n=1 Tax=Catellatospora chokoriensis TaxID=310353 RepID=A0A8J3NRU0_9ACTN|nr:hypothetical protein [Catellatospora chokoriensis]GIF89773.1 hypothetical protein Cch02nite_32170 [Catellatospora chokoriensis]
MRDDDPVLNVVLDSLISCVALLDEHVHDEFMDGRIALKQLENLSYDFGQLPDEQRRRLAALIRARAAAHPHMTAFVEGLPDSLGLDDD